LQTTTPDRVDEVPIAAPVFVWRGILDGLSNDRMGEMR
jgi:hypothetical protein